MLVDNVSALTRPDRPRGCLSIQGGLSCGPANSAIADFLAASRLGGEEALAVRLARAVDEGDLPAGSDPSALARFVMTFADGQAVHAAAGVEHDQLLQSAQIALSVFADAATRYPTQHPASGVSRT
ncbi:TetR family transcriptional regulator C-terminal domain-containing protein [Pseudonocardia sp. GCM10023141]|uniref:TetR family transcriptional regulator C-terminal domain-containing protein n=1 Tax=Pseudonocardia sp. GCM10023141 TaxID=3252653 RepID=UPI00360B8E98